MQNDNKLQNILLVEDDSVDVMNVQRAFKKNNIANPLYIAFNGVEAFNMLRGTNGKPKLNPVPRIILLDINMPKMNGLEFLRELRNDPEFRSISVFVMTTSNDDNDKIEAYKLNVAGYILKPLSFEKFVNSISILNSYWKLCEQPETSTL
ncbi:MAG: response regulator [Bacteroidetes bacterium]|nr:response regulator [Bacteroidota bacterium]